MTKSRLEMFGSETLAVPDALLLASMMFKARLSEALTMMETGGDRQARDFLQNLIAALDAVEHSRLSNTCKDEAEQSSLRRHQPETEQ